MVPTKARYVAVPGNYFLVTEHPRKELLDLLGYKHAEKVYVNQPNGEATHIGYVIGGIWYTLYAIEGLGPRNPKE